VARSARYALDATRVKQRLQVGCGVSYASRLPHSHWSRLARPAAFSVDSAAPERRVARIWLGSGPARSACAAGAPRPRRCVRATWRALSRRPHGIHAYGGDVPDRAASRCGDEPKMLQVLARVSPGELIVRCEHSAQRIEHILSRLHSRTALAERSRNLQYTCDNPTLLVGLVEGDCKVDRGRHGQSVARSVWTLDGADRTYANA
jgi:hypothetical protein